MKLIGWLSLPDGNFYSLSNGNIVDTLNRTPLTTTTNGNTITYTLLTPQGSTGGGAYTVTTESIGVGTSFGQSGVTECSSCSVTVIQSIQLPDGTSYSFNYDTGTGGHYGLLTSMTLPTGATINYNWGSPFTDAQGNHYEWLRTRTTPDSANPWQYAPNVVTSCGSGQFNCQQTNKITKPNGDTTIYTFTLNGGAWQSQIQSYTGSSSLVSTVNQCWNFVTINSNGQCTYSLTTTAASNVLKSAVSTTLPIPTGTVTETTEYTYNSCNQAQIQSLTCVISEWDFGNSPANPADRTTSFAYQQAANYVNAHILNRPTSVTVTNSGGGTVAQTLYTYDGGSLTSVAGMPNHDDTNFGTSNSTRGNVTLVQKLVSGSNYANSSMTYDTTGQVRTSTDSNNYQTTYAYSGTYYNAYPTTITNALSQATNLGYDFNTGLLTSAQDPNSQTTSFSYDNMGRPLTTTYPDGGLTTVGYNYSGGVYTGTTTTKKVTSSLNAVTTDNVDGLGRVTSSVITSDPEGQTTIATQYDSNGRVLKVSNPYRSTSDYTYGWQTPAYDGLDRVTQITEQDGGVRRTYYGAAVSTGGGQASQLCSGYGVGYPIFTLDEAGKKRQTWVDGFGRTIEANEPDSSNNLTVSTCYAYDLNNNLTQVVQGSETRSYAYDMISRLISKTEPESGTKTYVYDSDPTMCGNGAYTSNGDLVKTVDAAGNCVMRYYDSLHRLHDVGNNNQALSHCQRFLYDNSPGYPGSIKPSGITNTLGRLMEAATSKCDNTGDAIITDEWFSYDPTGRIMMNNQCTPYNCGTAYFPVGYTYDLLGDMTSYTNGVGVTLTQNFDTAGRIMGLTSSLVDAQHPATLAVVDPNLGYYPTGDLHVMTFGNGLTETDVVEPRLQRCVIDVNSSGTLLTACNPTIPTGNVQWFGYSFNWGTTNSGNVASWAGVGTQSFTRTYTYDNPNRLATMSSPSDPSGCTGLSWAYDRWGNRTAQSNTGGTCNTWSATYNNNQITGFQYDAAGDLTNDGIGGHTYTYDSWNRIIKVDGGNTATYIYDAEGRARKVVGSATTDYVHNLSGQVAAEVNGSGTWTNSYVYMGGRLLALYSGGTSGTTYFVHQDHLGSSRLLTSMNKSVYDSMDYLPFGEQIAGDTSTAHKFTGYERDSETGNDYASNRYYGSRYGSFMSPDPTGIFLGNLNDPQSLNLYSYVRNNPLNFTDPSGLCFNPKNPNLPAYGPCAAEYRNTGPTTFDVFAEFQILFAAFTPTYYQLTQNGDDATPVYGNLGLLGLLGGGSGGNSGGNSSGGFFSGLKDKFLDFLSRNANYLPGVCTAGAFGFGTGGVGNDKAGAEGGLLYDKQIGQPGTVQRLGEVSYGPIGVGGTPSEVLVFVQTAPKAGVVFAANPQNGFINNSGISIGLFAGGFGHKKGVAGGAGGGAYLTFSSAANCVKNF
jgi:RHS repeat-associated protein